MNKIIGSQAVKEKQETTVEDLLRQVYSHEHLAETAFIGDVGYSENKLFLIAYDIVIRADKPNMTYSEKCPVVVDRFVDVEIHIKEK